MDFQTKYCGPWVDVDEHDLLTYAVGEWKTRSPVVEVDKCTHCGQCYLYCPTGCIVDKEEYFEANLDFCKGCGICSKVCAVGAIKMTAGGKQ
jgi:pyruvate ferredoxin oxidoreductase delta subunit